MSNAKNKNHPWREPSPGVPTIDPVISTRSSRFAAYLDTLPREGRRQIEAAERAFVMKANAATGKRQSAARDYADGMLGVKESPGLA